MTTTAIDKYLINDQFFTTLNVRRMKNTRLSSYLNVSSYINNRLENVYHACFRARILGDTRHDC